MKIAAGIGIVLFLLAAAALAFVFSGAYDVGATSAHASPTWRLMRTVMERSVRRHARNVRVPELDDPEKVHRGFTGFHAMCVTCHGAPGVKPSEIGQGLNPKAPNLAEAARAWTAAELYVIIKHGIKMTGMPAWGPTHDDNQLWALVAFLRVLPDMPADEYAAAAEYHRTKMAGNKDSLASTHQH
jgi:mono/diheme cytochrome c family protein